MQQTPYEKHIEKLQEKFGLKRLELDNRPEQKVTTLQDAVDERERTEKKNFKLAFGSTVYKGEKLNIWFDKSR